MVTAERGLAVGVVTADCGPILFADARGGVVAAAHAGWRGAVGGVLERTVETMVELGARRDRIEAVLGPCITQPNYEVGADMAETFLAQGAENARFFAPGASEDKRLFDLPAFILARLERLGVAARFVGRCTYAEEDAFFSFRRTTHRGEATTAGSSRPSPRLTRTSTGTRHAPFHAQRIRAPPRAPVRRDGRAQARRRAALRQDSMFWLTGYDTFGFCFFQCLVVKADGEMRLLTRSADLRQARATSNIETIVVWRDRAAPIRRSSCATSWTTWGSSARAWASNGRPTA